MQNYFIPILVILISLLLLVGCKEESSNTPNPGEEGNTNPSTPNILFIIADDLGKDAMTGYEEGAIKPNTPVLDSIRESGLTFENFWVYPSCSPTRASIITGRYGHRTGVENVGDLLSQSETTLHQYITEQSNETYVNALIGKWHLSGSQNTNPEDYGIEYYAGIMGGGVGNYFNWNLYEDGSETQNTNYTTEVITDLASSWIDTQNDPWFLWLAYNAPHLPFHSPPADLHYQENLTDYIEGEDGTRHYMAAIEAMDTEIGRLINGIPQAERDNTYIVFIGDNGTPTSVAQEPFSTGRSKGSIYQGGVNTPMFISGPGVTRTGQIETGLINGTDLYSTLSQITGNLASEINDSKSFISLLSNETVVREYQYSQRINNASGEPNVAIRNERFKLHQYEDYQELYRISTDPYENSELISQGLNANQEEARLELEAKALEIRQ